MALNARFDLSGYSRYTALLDLTTSKDEVVIGASAGNQAFDAISATIESGTGSGQANAHWHDERTLADAATDSLDLSGGLTDPFGTALTLASVKLLLIDIDSPNGTKALRVGPNNTANAWQGPFGGTGANVYVTVDQTLFLINEYDGWTVTAGTGDLLIINNSSGTSVTYRILIVGVD